MTARDCPSNPFQANMIFPSEEGGEEREEMAESDPAVPVLIQGLQLEGMHCRTLHMSEKWVRVCQCPDLAVPSSPGWWQQAGQVPGLSPGSVLSPTG